jgi:hypothetical protein
VQIFGRNQPRLVSLERPSALSLLFGAWGFAFLLWLCSVDAIVAVAIHFIKKFW